MSDAPVPVAIVASRTEADLIAGLLLSHGLAAAVVADDAGGQEPQWQLSGVRVVVPAPDAPSARALLQELPTLAGGDDRVRDDRRSEPQRPAG